MAQIEAKPDADAVAADAFDIARFAEIHARGLLTRGTLAPLLDAAKIADRRGYDRGFAEATERAQQILEHVAEERGTTAYAVLAEVRERLARGVVGVEVDVVGGNRG